MELQNWKINGVNCMVHEGRQRSNAPDGFPFTYMSRHADSDMSIPSTVERYAAVNFWGYIFAEQEIIPADSYHTDIKTIEDDQGLLFDADDPFFTEDNEEENEEV